MLPSKGRKKIVIDGVTWYYLVHGYVEVICHNPDNGKIIKWYEDVKPKWQTQITPKLVEEIIRTEGKPAGWGYAVKPKKYITTTLPYANSVPHIGHAFEFIIGDAISRYFKKKLGKDNVHFNVGLDEHGKKIHDAAIASGKTTQEYLDGLSIDWKSFCLKFGINYDSFYRTSEPKHYEGVSKFWNELKSKGLIYKKSYVGNYCVGCESFKLDKDLEDGKCPDHQTLEIQQVSEENYFFALSKFKKELSFWFESECYLRPLLKREELKNIIEDIQDISISRKRESVPWGVPVPGDSSQVIYVWFDALLNYILVLGYYDDKENFNAHWNDSVQVFGPDNLKFQSVIFQGLLSAVGIKHTGALLCHGTILDKNGRKMSKTVGNVIDPIDQVSKYGIDAVRFYALSGLHTYGNSGWSEEQLVDLHNSFLADNYGNLLTRVIHLINLRDKDEKFDDCNYITGGNIDYDLFQIHLDTVKALWENYDVSAAVHKLNDILKIANQYITDKAPWSKDAQDVEVVLSTLHWVLREVTRLYEPIIPESAKKAEDSLWKFEKIILFPKIKIAENETANN